MPTPNERLRHERELRGWSQAHLGGQIGVPEYYISRWERGEFSPSPYYRQKLCVVFGKTAEELGLLQSRGDPVQSRESEPHDSSSPLLDQLPFPQARPTIQLPQPSFVPSAPSAPQGKSSRPGPFSKQQLPVGLALVVVILVSAGLGTFLLTRTGPTMSTKASSSTTASAVLGHLYFLSSGQTNVTSSQGIADEVQLDLQLARPPAAGKSYFAWLLPDEDQPENRVVPLGKVTLTGETGHIFYSDPEHTNLLAITSRLLVTEEDAAITPLFPSPDRRDWRYTAEIPQTVPPRESYSLLDHLRHLLAADPKLQVQHLPGGLAIWLYRNTQAIYEWAMSAQEAWEAGQTATISAMRQDLIRMLDYLDGILYVKSDVPSTITSPVLVDPRQGRIGLLEFNPEQQPPCYIDHINLHLDGLTFSPGSTPLLQEKAATIRKALSAISSWLEQVRQDAKHLVALTDEQLLQQQTLTLLSDMTMKTNFAFNGKTDLNTGNMQEEGVVWIYQAIQRLAVMDITTYRG